VSEAQLSDSLERDQFLLKRAEANDMSGYFKAIAAEGDRRRICGLPPTYTTLQAIGATRGQLLHYGRFVHPLGDESVSFASMVFE
jgi:hypothetical protein